MPEDRRIDITDADDAVRELVAECEVSGRRTVITRGPREVAILLAHDEYTAMRETLAITATPALAHAIGLAEEQISRGDLLLATELDGATGDPLERLRFPWRVRDEWASLGADDREASLRAFVRLDDDPICGAPLYEPVKGYWSLREGSLRILYRIAPEARAVFVLHIGKVDKSA